VKDKGGQCSDRPIPEYVGDRHVSGECLRHHERQFCARQGVAAKREEIPQHTEIGLWNAEQCSPEDAKSALDVILWSLVRHYGRIVNRGKPLGVEFATDRDWKRLDLDKPVWDQMFWQAPLQLLSDIKLPEIMCRNEVANEKLLCDIRSFQMTDLWYHGGMCDVSARVESRLDLAELDSLATELDLLVFTSKVFNFTVG
jgi:hypothetical protein